MSNQTTGPQKDWQLLTLGDQEGLHQCFHYFYDDLFRFGISMYRDPELARDGIHDLFVELWKIRQRLSSVTNIKEYILTIYKRILYKAWQKKRMESAGTSFALGEDDAAIAGDLAQASYETLLIASQEEEAMKVRLRKLLDKLSPRQKQLIQLRFYEHASIKEIAEQTALTERTIYNTLYNALQLLREIMSIALLFHI